MTEAYHDWVKQRWCENDIEVSKRLSKAIEFLMEWTPASIEAADELMNRR